MTGLPTALERWRPQLDLFAPQVQVGLGSLISRLALAIGSLSAEGGGRGGEPDGYDGIDRRGSYERLLVSEWLLADELPDEFIRRAAEREHVFAHVAHRRPAGTRRSVALFDGGPDQLGSPRVAQLAALLVLAARAEKAGARFGWGLVQGSTVHEEVSAASLALLLQGRSVREATEADLLGWQERLGTPSAADDLWWVGGRPLASRQQLGRGSLLRIEDLLEPGQRRVRVEVRRGQSKGRSVELELPHPAICVRLLRDPFAARATAPARIAGGQRPHATLLFSAKGAHLLGRLEDGAVWMQSVPNSSAAIPGNVTVARLRAGERLLAAGFDRRRVRLLVQQGDRLALRETGRRGGDAGAAIELQTSVPIPHARAGVPERLLPLFGHRIGTGALRSDESFVLTANGKLLTLVEGNALKLMASRVAAVAPFFGQIAWLADGEPGSSGRRIEIHDGFTGRTLPVELGDHQPLEGFFGFGGGFNEPLLRGIAAVRLSTDGWRLVQGEKDAAREVVVSGGRVVGVARDGAHGGVPALVMLGDDRRTLRLVGARTVRTLPLAGAEIVEVACSHTDARVAWLTRAGEVVVWSLDTDTAVLRLWVGGAP